MPRKTRKQYKKKTKRGGMNTINEMTKNMKQKASNMGNDMKKTASNIGDMAKNTKKKTTGFFSNLKFPFFENKKQPEKEQPEEKQMTSPESPPESSKQMGQMVQQPSKPTGGKRKSRRFIKKKGKVTLQGGRRIRSRKSKTRCRTRRRR
tara:strand:- start:780 stop:1226 length:447 start_codon:yes stop_codon:yes gene_type:complete